MRQLLLQEAKARKRDEVEQKLQTTLPQGRRRRREDLTTEKPERVSKSLAAIAVSINQCHWVRSPQNLNLCGTESFTYHI